MLKSGKLPVYRPFWLKKNPLEKHLCLKHHRKSHHPLQVSVVGFAA
jgi:hypothetical protein